MIPSTSILALGGRDLSVLPTACARFGDSFVLIDTLAIPVIYNISLGKVAFMISLPEIVVSSWKALFVNARSPLKSISASPTRIASVVFVKSSSERLGTGG